ncbi:RNA-dependent ATPase [Friedmanniomyces endolithicus]|uniref:RNA helicase n=1 Tax=Friedmanniomyces endolithicus TaxID=329885 RepID=A0AAN6KS88_9PEZI|nr:RNA-dependent ATPase [Friedmanniomyces endolithicus]KAK0956058.1 RNA-dependent ATPase [Friedmanniomyces endolithicus]KAK0999932.1 RNA-dependent ATPase [Friedmanniomyces endolithicus]KAK1030353.1 RNA-dependent ATPase [Friedmanniomyces endolithicus]
MSKRSHDDAAASGDPKEARREAKRLKKEKKAQKTEPSDGDVAVPAQLDAVVSEKQPTSTDEILSKDERKALRRAQKQAARAPEAREVARPATGTLGDQEAAAKAERKAVKLAEKSARKVAKPSEHGNGQTSGEITAGDKHGAGISGRENVDESAYREDTGLAALPQSDIDTFVADNHLAIEDPHKQAYRPIIDFKYLPGDATQRAPFANFSAPTPIQAACWPYLFAGRDVIGVAETGSGKTLAFGLPCVRYIASLPKSMRSGVKACMVSPTRELAMQIHEQLVKLAEPAGVKVVCVYGGMSKDEQRRTLKGAHVVVATPGRLNDFLQEGAIDLSGATYVVLDEADRMLDKGFEEEVRKIISTTAPTGRQTLMFTATWPPSVRELADTFMKGPVKVMIGENASGELRANARIVQEVEVTTQIEKQPRLIQLLKEYQSGKNKNDRILVFCLYKKEATRIEEFIRRRGFNVGGIHGDLSQQKRIESLDAFKVGKVPILMATDVAARGLDIPAVKLVINVTFPLTVEDYVHRIGRTGRAGQDGKAVTMFTDAEKHLAGGLINVLKAANQAVPEELMKFGTTVKKKGHEAYGAFYKDTADMKKATKITFD